MSQPQTPRINVPTYKKVQPYYPQLSSLGVQSAKLPNIPVRLPGRLNAEQTATVLGFEKHNIPVLIRANLLKPLGTPTHNAVKYFPACVVTANSEDLNWLHQATIVVGENWLFKNASRKRAVEVEAQVSPASE